MIFKRTHTEHRLTVIDHNMLFCNPPTCVVTLDLYFKIGLQYNMLSTEAGCETDGGGQREFAARVWGRSLVGGEAI